MASSSSSSSSPSLDNITISKEEIKQFHGIDRAIFARLVLHLRRDPGQSMHVMALFLWLERSRCSNARNLVNVIQPWPDTFINALADEAVQCLDCMKKDKFPYSHSHGANHIIPLIRMLTKHKVSFRFFHDNRLDIITGIVRIVDDVCVKAFDDIIQRAFGSTDPMASARVMRTEQNLEPLRFSCPLTCPSPVLPVCEDFIAMNMGNQTQTGASSDFGYYGSDDADDLSLSAQRKSLNDELAELLNQIHIIRINNLQKNNDNDNKEVPADDRTIFLTFSKGYPISENEVEDFFTRRFGEGFVEAVEMQEVGAREQPLYARMVLKSALSLEMILKGEPKAKFTINGKHVWSRKFVPKSLNSPLP